MPGIGGGAAATSGGIGGGGTSGGSGNGGGNGSTPSVRNIVIYTLAANYTSGTLTGSNVSTGLFTPFTPQVNGDALVLALLNASPSAGGALQIRRTAGPAPTDGTVAPAGDPIILNLAANGAGARWVTGAIYDVGLTVGVTYNYYICVYATTGTMQLLSPNVAQFQIVER